jgi:Methane oxygenase PmoA
VTRYHTSGYPRPIFWPVHAPGGQPLTRDWPMGKTADGGSTDHVHQKSLWFCHGDVIPEGIDLKQKIKGVDGVDFWSEAPGHGKIVCTRIAKPRYSGGHGVLATHNEWRTADGSKILDEERTIHLYDLGKARLIVLDIDLHASVAAITFGDTKEGALGVRINDVIRGGKFGGRIENAQGKVGEKECWGRISDWCDYSGPIDGKTVGLTVFADPKNAHPTYWHVRDYGLMAANPFGRKKAAFHDGAADKSLVRLAKGEHLELRYGVLLHDGDATTGQVAEHYQRFVKLREKQ